MVRTSETPYKRARTEEQKRERLNGILSVAENLLAGTAYRDITMSMIAREVGCSRANLAHYVSSKEEIFLLLYVRSLGELLDDLKSLDWESLGIMEDADGARAAEAARGAGTVQAASGASSTPTPVETAGAASDAGSTRTAGAASDAGTASPTARTTCEDDIAAIARTFASMVARHEDFGRLGALLSSIVEVNVSLDRLTACKMTIMQLHSEGAALLAEKGLFTSVERAGRFLLDLSSYASGLFPSTHPLPIQVEAMRAAGFPSQDYEKSLREYLTVQLAGYHALEK